MQKTAPTHRGYLSFEIHFSSKTGFKIRYSPYLAHPPAPLERAVEVTERRTVEATPTPPTSTRTSCELHNTPTRCLCRWRDTA